MMFFKRNAIQSKLVPLKKLEESTIREMHALFIQYYDHADYETFKTDLSDKTGSFLWRERATGRLIAFANIRVMHLKYGRRKVHGFFCGDTVCHRDYWQRNTGTNNPMAGTVYWFLLRFMLIHPFSGTYWFMISMSFRTYLLIANNLINHYPHYQRNDKTIQKLGEICTLFGKHMYGDKYDAETGLVDFGRHDENQTIKSDVAPVSEEMMERYPKIRFYEQLNPDNTKGIEMACIGSVDMTTMLAYLVKYARRFFNAVFGRKNVKTMPQRKPQKVAYTKGDREDRAAA